MEEDNDYGEDEDDLEKEYKMLKKFKKGKVRI